jgi:glutamate-1-semialdehyde aminotransferase
MRQYERGSGSRIYTADGSSALDFVCGYGPVILGHGHPRITKVVADCLSNGLLLPGSRRIEDALRERLRALFGDHRDVTFLKTGSEAVAAAIRLARLATGRPRVLRSGFHGWHDGLIDGKVGWHNWDNLRYAADRVPGTLGQFADEGVDLATASTLDEFQRLLADHAGELAAVVVDPIQLREPEEELQALRRLCRQTGTVLILDETKTAFRTHPAGVDRRYDVESDLIVAGKGLANGLPLSAVIGDPSLLQTRKTRIKGTFNAELASLSAACETLAVLEETAGAIHLDEIGSRLIDGLNRVFKEYEVADTLSAVPYRWASMPHIHAATDNQAAQELRSAFVDECERQGALFLDGHNSFLSTAHDAGDIDECLQLAAAALERMRG